VVDRIMLPTGNQTAYDMGDDLTGNGGIQNQIGMVIGTLLANCDATTHGTDMIATGVIASMVEIQAESLGSAARVGVTFYGYTGAAATVAGGAIVDGVFTSNRTRTTHVPGAATLVLPVFADAAPITVELHGMEIDLTPDGSGGYDAAIRGGIPEADAMMSAATGMIQMMFDDPADHEELVRTAAPPLTIQDIEGDSLIESLLAPDVTLFGEQDVSLGFQAHLVPCPSGDCALATPADACADRVKDGDETDVDCGGSCGLPCPGGSGCVLGSDCQSQACIGGICAAPGCSDGILDGFESDVDCGWTCPGCALGKICYSDADCASGNCDADFGSGTCLPMQSTARSVSAAASTGL
jgi:hypothetical protein